jgi:hypothetical protein
VGDLMSAACRAIRTSDADRAFSEQFKDQLRLAMQLNGRAMLQESRECLASQKAHVRRYAGWVLSHGLAGNDD